MYKAPGTILSAQSKPDVVCTPAIPMQGRWRQVDPKVKVTLTILQQLRFNEAQSQKQQNKISLAEAHPVRYPWQAYTPQNNEAARIR